jgi:nucleoside-diphosphate-sugar epimerase
MGVFVAGATGAIGKQLVPRLVAVGHEVHGIRRSESKQATLSQLGAVPAAHPSWWRYGFAAAGPAPASARSPDPGPARSPRPAARVA